MPDTFWFPKAIGPPVPLIALPTEAKLLNNWYVVPSSEFEIPTGTPSFGTEQKLPPPVTLWIIGTDATEITIELFIEELQPSPILVAMT